VSDLHPTDGARFLFERAAAEPDGARATYRAAIYTPDAMFTATATLVDDGTVELGATGAPAELHDLLAMFGKLTARGAAKRRDDGMPVWPARILRWRR
jgi:hypothetical protein